MPTVSPMPGLLLNHVSNGPVLAWHSYQAGIKGEDLKRRTGMSLSPHTHKETEQDYS